MRPKRTNVPLHANRIVAVVLCQNHRGKQLVHLTHHKLKYTGAQESTVRGDLWGLSRESSRLSFHPPKAIWHFPKILALPYTCDEILSSHEDDVSSIRDSFSAWVKADPETILRRHVVDAKGFFPAFREAPARRHEPSHEYRRLCVYNWNPGPRRGKEEITLQEAIEYFEHDFLTIRFHVTHYGGSINLHDTRAANRTR